jgi:ParB-like chromosome segregation protein Spo0J
MLQEIPVESLVAHPDNSNHMSVEMLRKLRRHIERTDRYEPLTVRPHPTAEGKYEVLNGHNRLRVLRAIGQHSVRCVVWDVDDAQARLCLATLNRLAGSDIPERRVALLENLLGTFDVAELSGLLPDSQRQIEELQRLSRLDTEELISSGMPDRGESGVPVILDFVLEESEAKEVNLALDMVQALEGQSISSGQALVRLARFYLARCKPSC